MGTAAEAEELEGLARPAKDEEVHVGDYDVTLRRLSAASSRAASARARNGLVRKS